jgi:hypothetical protein
MREICTSWFDEGEIGRLEELPVSLLYKDTHKGVFLVKYLLIKNKNPLRARKEITS